MSDITIQNLVDKIPDGDSVKTWWTSAAALPADVSVNEFFAKTLLAAHEAQVAENQNLVSPNLIDGYPQPIYGAVTLDTATGQQAFITTLSVRTLVPATFDNNISPVT